MYVVKYRNLSIENTVISKQPVIMRSIFWVFFAAALRDLDGVVLSDCMITDRKSTSRFATIQL